MTSWGHGGKWGGNGGGGGGGGFSDTYFSSKAADRENKTLYLAEIPIDWDEPALKKMCEDAQLPRASTFNEVKWLPERNAASSRSLMLKFASHDDAAAALEVLHGHHVWNFSGQAFTVSAKWAERKGQRSNDWHSGGGGWADSSGGGWSSSSAGGRSGRAAGGWGPWNGGSAARGDAEAQDWWGKPAAVADAAAPASRAVFASEGLRIRNRSTWHFATILAPEDQGDTSRIRIEFITGEQEVQPIDLFETEDGKPLLRAPPAQQLIVGMRVRHKRSLRAGLVAGVNSLEPSSSFCVLYDDGEEALVKLHTFEAEDGGALKPPAGGGSRLPLAQAGASSAQRALGGDGTHHPASQAWHPSPSAAVPAEAGQSSDVFAKNVPADWGEPELYHLHHTAGVDMASLSSMRLLPSRKPSESARAFIHFNSAAAATTAIRLLESQVSASPQPERAMRFNLRQPGRGREADAGHGGATSNAGYEQQVSHARGSVGWPESGSGAGGGWSSGTGMGDWGNAVGSDVPQGAGGGGWDSSGVWSGVGASGGSADGGGPAAGGWGDPAAGGWGDPAAATAWGGGAAGVGAGQGGWHHASAAGAGAGACGWGAAADGGGGGALHGWGAMGHADGNACRGASVGWHDGADAGGGGGWDSHGTTSGFSSGRAGGPGAGRAGGGGGGGGCGGWRGGAGMQSSWDGEQQWPSHAAGRRASEQAQVEPVWLGLRVRQKRTWNTGSVIKVEGHMPGSFRVRFDDGQEDDHAFDLFETENNGRTLGPSLASMNVSAEPGVRVRNTRTGRMGVVAELTPDCRDGWFSVRFNDGEVGMRELVKFKTLDGRTLVEASNGPWDASWSSSGGAGCSGRANGGDAWHAGGDGAWSWMDDAWSASGGGSGGSGASRAAREDHYWSSWSGAAKTSGWPQETWASDAKRGGAGWGSERADGNRRDQRRPGAKAKAEARAEAAPEAFHPPPEPETARTLAGRPVGSRPVGAGSGAPTAPPPPALSLFVALHPPPPLPGSAGGKAAPRTGAAVAPPAAPGVDVGRKAQAQAPVAADAIKWLPSVASWRSLRLTPRS